ncbi:hypothetical protein GCM10018789_59600 [Streptomyces werraensis]|nr:hypothetical protein GCM10018789_59600 [Streptomyces werraensis]
MVVDTPLRTGAQTAPPCSAHPGRLQPHARQLRRIRSPQPIEVHFGTTTPAEPPEADWEQPRAVETDRRSPLAALAKQAAQA